MKGRSYPPTILAQDRLFQPPARVDFTRFHTAFIKMAYPLKVSFDGVEMDHGDAEKLCSMCGAAGLDEAIGGGSENERLSPEDDTGGTDGRRRRKAGALCVHHRLSIFVNLPA